MVNSTHLREEIARKTGYNPQHDPAELVLDANESPYDLPGELEEAYRSRLETIEKNRYPDATADALREQFARYLEVNPERLVAGNGSDELIGYLLLACLNPGDTVLVVEPSFSMYRILAEQYHATVDTVALNHNWDLPDDIVSRAREAKLMFIGSPNNPTGNRFDRDVILELVKESAGLVVVDEAYAEFADGSLVQSVSDHDSLVVLRTLSKAFGLASARVGFLVGPETIVQGVNTVRLPYNLNSLSQAMGELVLENYATFRSFWDTLRDERERMYRFLLENGFNPSPSEANFILFQPNNPRNLYNDLLEDDIRIRAFDEGPVEDYLRLTLGTPEENQRLRKSLESYIDQHNS